MSGATKQQKKLISNSFPSNNRIRSLFLDRILAFQQNQILNCNSEFMAIMSGLSLMGDIDKTTAKRITQVLAKLYPLDMYVYEETLKMSNLTIWRQGL